jgi:uncharacterized membrane protein YccC
MTTFTSRDWIFAIKIAVAALLALGIAFWVDLPRPYWAVVSIYTVSQPLSGATTSKAAYRLYGTILGAIAAVVLVPNLVNIPELLCLALALWISGCLYFSLLDRTPRSYVLMLAGFTAAFVGFPLVNDPGSIFDFAVSRVEEIGLGIICAAMVSAVVLPESVVPMLRNQLDQWFHEAEDRIIAILGRRPLSDDPAPRLHLACGAVAFDALITPLQYDISTGARFADAVATLRQHMLMFLPIMTAIHDRIGALQKLNALPAAVRTLLDDMAAEVRAPSLAEIRRQREALSIFAATLPEPLVAWTDLMLATLAVRLGDYLDLRQDTLLLRGHIAKGEPMTEPYAFQYTAGARTVRHRDQLMALLSAMAALIAILGASAFWIAASWPDGYAAPMLAAAGCSLFAAQDDPAVQINGLGKAGMIGAVACAIYLFAILPQTTTFEMVVVALAPGLVLCGLLMTKPRTGIYGLGIVVLGFTLLALQNNYSGDFAAYANSAVAVVIGVWTAALTTQLFRSVGAAWTARRLWRTNRNSLVTAAEDRNDADAVELAALMLDRVGLLASRLAALPPEDSAWTSELLAEVRVGIDLVELQRACSTMTAEQAAEIDRLFTMIGRHFRSDALHPKEELLKEIDVCLDRFVFRTSGPCRRMTRALTDLRRSLFPDAPPFTATGGSEPSRSGLAA